jgi:hypothetical protein
VVGVVYGGTGLATLTANNVILGNGTSTPQFVAPGTTGNVLTSNGSTWQSTAPASAVQRWTLINSTSITSALSNFSVAVANEDLFIVVSNVTCNSGAQQIAFSTNSGSSYTSFVNMGSFAYGNVVLTGIELGSIRSMGSGNGTADISNPNVNTSTTLAQFTYNPGAAITNIKIGCSGGNWSNGGTVNTYGRN